MNLILKKIRGECGLGEPTKLTYYRNTAGKVVFKAWFDELITPQDLIGTDRELSSSKLNKFHSQFHDEDELEYEDDFAIVDFNLHKGWVKFIPNDQDYNYVESVKDIQKNKLNEKKLTLTKGKLLTEKLAEAFDVIYEDDAVEELEKNTKNFENKTAKDQDTKKDIPPTKIFVYSGRALTLCPDAVSKAFSDFTAMAEKLQKPDEAGGEPFTIKTLYVPYSDYLLLGALGYSKTFEALPVDAQKANLYLDDFAVNTVSIQELNLLATSDKPVKMFLSDPTAAEKCKALAGYISKFDSTANVDDNAAIKIFADLKAAEETALQQLEAACKSFLESFKKHLDNKDFAKGEELFRKEDSGETEEQKDNNSDDQNNEQTDNSNDSSGDSQTGESSETSGDTTAEEGQQ